MHLVLHLVLELKGGVITRDKVYLYCLLSLKVTFWLPDTLNMQMLTTLFQAEQFYTQKKITENIQHKNENKISAL